MRAFITRGHLSVLPFLLAAGLLLPTAQQAHADTPAGSVYSAPLAEAVAALPQAEENRTGYSRKAFRHWTDADKDSCSTRAEVLIEESLEPVAVGPRCALTGGEWRSEYDQKTFKDPRKLDIDHRVPLAEAFDSGASGWSAEERERYANDLDDPRSLLAVTAGENRSKADKDPPRWIPTDPTVLCRYAADWTAVKIRWGLSVDADERGWLLSMAAACEEEIVTVATARNIPYDY